MNIEQMIDSIKGMTPTATDAVALKSITLYPMWIDNIGKAITQKEIDEGKDRYQYEGVLYRAIQPHIFQDIYPPPIVPALWTVVNVGHAGTLEDPIPAAVSMEYTRGLYYIEAETIYLMNRQGMEDGKTVALHYLPSQLVGQYFEVVK